MVSPHGTAAPARADSLEDLVEDALVAGLPRVESAPDPGGVREDLLALCRQVRQIMYAPPGAALRPMIHECDQSQAERLRDAIVGGSGGAGRQAPA